MEPEVYLETERLILRAFGADDVENLFDLDSDPEVRRYVNQPNPPTRAEAEQNLARFLVWYEQPGEYGYFAIIEKATGAFLGWLHFRPEKDNVDNIEIGWRLKREAWGRGYATEAAQATLRKGFLEQGVNRITAKAMTENTASIRVMQKIGLRYDHDFLYDNRLPCVWYALARTAYLQQAELAVEQV